MRMLWILFILCSLDIFSALWLVSNGPFPLIIKEIGATSAYLNVYVHVPAAVTMYILALAALILSLKGLIKGLTETGMKRMDFLAYSVAILSWYAFISGTIWSAESWGSPFTLDPRQMTVLVLALMFSIYPAIRKSVEDPEKNVRLAQVFIVAGFGLAILALLAPAIAQQAFHPKPGTALTGSMGIYMGVRILIVTGVLFSIAFLRGGKTVVSLYLVGSFIALALLYPWILYAPVRVIDAGPTYITLENGKIIAVDPASIRDPPFFQGKSTIVGNFVYVIDGNVALVRHYSAFINTALYFISMAIIVWMRDKL